MLLLLAVPCTTVTKELTTVATNNMYSAQWSYYKQIVVPFRASLPGMWAAELAIYNSAIPTLENMTE